MHVAGFAKFAFCCGAWMIGCFAVPVSLLLSWYKIHFGSIILTIYYSFRLIRPAKFWQKFLDVICLNDTPYCNNQRIVFDKGATIPLPNSKTMVAVGPHGILSIGFQTLVSSREYSKLGFKWLVAEILSSVPFLSDINAWSNIVSCDKKNMTAIMSSGENIGLIPGGFEEATIYKRNRYRLFLKNRKGFIKYALMYGYSIQPCFVFGEEKTYWQLDLGSLGFEKVALWLNHFKIPTTLFLGKFLFLPDNNCDINVVVGKLLEIPQISQPTAADIDKFHKKYTEAVEDIFARYKLSFGCCPEDVLEIK